METVADYPRRVDVAVETKHPTRYAGLVETRLAELIEAFGWAGPGSRVRVMSFSWVALTRLKKLLPEIEVVMLIDKVYSWKAVKPMAGNDWIVGPDMRLIRARPKFGAKLRRNGRRVHVWTVNSPGDLDLCAELGVEAVITDKPGEALAHLTR
jgi:glycerophosphoryl diester phosphodiesterase